MNAHYESKKVNREPVKKYLTNVLVEEIEDMIQIHADGAFRYEFCKGVVIDEHHSDDQDIFKLADGTEITLSFID